MDNIFKQLAKDLPLQEAARRYYKNFGSTRDDSNTPNISHKIDNEGNHVFTGGYQDTKVIKSDDHEGLKSHLEQIHKNTLGQGRMFIAHSNKGSKEGYKVFNGGAPGVDALHKAVTSHITEEIQLDEGLFSKNESVEYNQEFQLGENKLSDVHYTISREIGPIYKTSVIDQKLKDRAAKEVSKRHGISSDAANKFVNDYCKSCNEESLEESNPFKNVDNIIRKVRNKAAVANLKGDKPAEEKYSKRLNKVMSYRNKMLATESIESAKQQLDNHVTNTEPTLSNITKMHDMVRNISKTHGVSSDKIYDQVKDNTMAHQKYRDAATA